MNKAHSASGSAFDLSGRTALVTGGSSGLGEAMALALGQAGARVLLLARRVEQLEAAAERLRAHGVRVDALAYDLALPASVQDAAREALAIAPVDILVNAAGVNLRQPFAEVTPETWAMQLLSLIHI